MTRIFKRFFDRYFTLQIDRALDVAAPLTGWTAWYVRRNPELRNYYEQMLEMELELRFPEIDDESTEISFRTTASSISHTAAESPHRHVLQAVAVVLFIAIGFTAYFSPLGRPFRHESVVSLPTVPPPVAAPIAVSDDDPTIDLAELFTWTLPETVKPAPAPRLTSLDDPVASFVHFTQQPLKTTLSLLESACIIERHPLYSGEL